MSLLAFSGHGSRPEFPPSILIPIEISLVSRGAATGHGRPSGPATRGGCEGATDVPPLVPRVVRSGAIPARAHPPGVPRPDACERRGVRSDSPEPPHAGNTYISASAAS
jgi:hypothetical protein